MDNGLHGLLRSSVVSKVQKWMILETVTEIMSNMKQHANEEGYDGLFDNVIPLLEKGTLVEWMDEAEAWGVQPEQYPYKVQDHLNEEGD